MDKLTWHDKERDRYENYLREHWTAKGEKKQLTERDKAFLRDLKYLASPYSRHPRNLPKGYVIL